MAAILKESYQKYHRKDMNVEVPKDENKAVKIAPLDVTLTTKNQDNPQIDIWKIIPIVISILSLVVSAINSYMTFSLTVASERREAQNQNLSYSLEAFNNGMKYEYEYGGEAKEAEAPTLKLKVTSGAVCAVTLIRFDDEGIDVAETVSPTVEDTLFDKEYYMTVDSDSPGKIVFDEEIAYDYFFLYIQPLSGEPILDLVCHRINLPTEMVDSRVYHRIDLLGIDLQDSYVFAQILKKYEQLYDLIKELPA